MFLWDKMGEIELKYNNTSEVISFAQSWNELTVRQLLYIANAWEEWKFLAKYNQSLHKAKALLLLEILNGNTFFNRKKRLSNFLLLPEDDLYDLTTLTSFIFKSITLTNCPLPWVKVGLRSFYAPNNNLANITAEEFHFADICFVKYHNTGDETALNNLIACLYRRAPSLFDRSGNKRVAFNNNLIERNGKILSGLNYDQKRLILLWYMGCRAAIVEAHPDLFSEGNSRVAKNEGWLPLILAMSGDKFGTFEQTGKTNFLLVLMEMEEINKRKPQTKE